MAGNAHWLSDGLEETAQNSGAKDDRGAAGDVDQRYFGKPAASG
jgi:hypothetical protein